MRNLEVSDMDSKYWVQDRKTTSVSPNVRAKRYAKTLRIWLMVKFTRHLFGARV